MRKQIGSGRVLLIVAFFGGLVPILHELWTKRGIINTSLSQIFQIARALDIHPKELFDFAFIKNG